MNWTSTVAMALVAMMLGGCGTSRVDPAGPAAVVVSSRGLPPASDAELTRALASVDASEREAAAHAIGRRGTATPAQVTELEAALGDDDVDVRRAATHALGVLGDSALPAADRLERLAGWATDLPQRYAAALALARIPSAAAHLDRLLVDPGSREAITVAFAGMGAEGRAALVGLTRSSHWRTRAAAVSALAIGEHSQPVGSEPGGTDAALARGLRDDSSFVRVAALRAVTRLSERSLLRLEHVRRAFGEGGSATERGALYEALAAGRDTGDLADPSVVAAAVLEALGHGLQSERLLGVRLTHAAGVRDEQVLRALARYASSDEVGIARESAACLRLLGQGSVLSDDVADTLRPALRHDRARVATESAAALVLGGHNAPELSEPLARLLFARGWGAWPQGTMASAPFGRPRRNLRAGGRAVGDLLPPVPLLALADIAPLLRRHPAATAAALEPFLASEYSATRANAAWMAAETLPPDQVDALLTPLLEDAVLTVRITAGLRLVQLDRHRDPIVRMFVETLLADRGDDHPEELQWDRELIAELPRAPRAAISALVTGYAAAVPGDGSEELGSLGYRSNPGDRHVRAILAALGPQGELLLIDELLRADLSRRHASMDLLRRIAPLGADATRRLRGLTSHAEYGPLARELLAD